jgi:3-(3-hydroxy-phenyl)propionate hydroxylase
MTDAGADVVIVGCGPVGVMAALRCAQQGLRVVALDRSPGIYPLPRAIGMDDEVQRIFQQAGILADLESVSSPMRGAEFVDAAGTRVVGFELPDGFVGQLGLPPVIAFEQPGVEASLRRAAAEAGVEFRFGVEAVAVAEDASGVSATVVDESGDEHTVRGRWLIGADGASSTIRQLLDIDFVDQGFDQPWLVVDTTLLDDQAVLPVLATQVCDPARVVTIIPGHGTRRRWEFQLAEGETREQMLDGATIDELLAPWVGPGQVRVDRAAVYRFHALVADRFRVGSVFLAGDAAHQMPPFNGQGMCSGMRDVQNLAWKLALVQRGFAADALLDTYNQERHPHATAQVAHSADAGRLIDALAQGSDASTASGYGGERPFPHIEAGFVVGDHSGVGRQLPQPFVAGERFDTMLPDGLALVARAGTSVDPGALAWWRALGAELVVVADDLFPGLVGDGTIVIVRPDRYVAAVTEDLADTTARLATLLQ